jgi:hypothetical protein
MDLDFRYFKRGFWWINIKVFDVAMDFYVGNVHLVTNSHACTYYSDRSSLTIGIAREWEKTRYLTLERKFPAFP